MYQAIEWWDNIPHEMRSYKRFMVCGSNKVPLNARTGYPAAKDDAANWISYGDACYFAEENGWLIGFVPRPDDPFTIIDLDNKPDRVYSAEDKQKRDQILDWALENTYVEKSSSGQGWHVIVRGKIAHDINKGKRGVEAYSNRGFVILTGNCISRTRDVADSNGLCDWIAQEYPAGAETDAAVDQSQDWFSTPSAEELAADQQALDWFMQFRNADRIQRWFYGSDFADPSYDRRSEDDASLMQLYYKFNKGRPNREVATVRMFLRSPRAKYLSRKGTGWHRYIFQETLPFVKTVVDREEQVEVGFKDAADAAYAQAMAAAQTRASIETEVAIAKASGILTNSAQAPVMPEANPFKFFSVDELRQRPPLDWVLKGVFPSGGMGAIWGESGSGKSFLVIDLLNAIATGAKWFGLRTKQCPVVCLALEGAGGLRQRVLGWEKANSKSFSNQVLFYDGSFALRDSNPQGENHKRLGQFCAALNNGHGSFDGVVVIDTLNQASDGADENSSRDMGQLIAGIKYIQEKTRSLVIVVHHATKSKEAQSMRGHSSFQAACDGIIEVRRVEGEENREWAVTKSKDGDDSISRAFDFPTVVLDGMDSDGDIITSRAVKPKLVDEVDRGTGEVVQSYAKAEPKSGGYGSGGGGGKRTRAHKDESTYDYSKGDSQPRSRSEAAEQDSENWSGMKPQAAILQAITAESIAAKSTGKYGTPTTYCAPADAVLERAIVLRNYPDPAQSRKDLKKQITNMIANGKVKGEMETGKIQWLWLP